MSAAGALLQYLPYRIRKVDKRKRSDLEKWEFPARDAARATLSRILDRFEHPIQFCCYGRRMCILVLHIHFCILIGALYE